MNPNLILLLFAAALFGLAGNAPAETRTNVLYPVENRIAAELVPLAEAVLGDSGSASLDARTNAILLVGPKRDVDAALAVLRTQDRPLRRVVVRQEWIGTERLDESGLQVSWSGTAGGVRVGTIPTPPPNDLVAVRAYADFLEAHSRNSSRVDVLEGSKARISSGTVVPYSVGRGIDASKADPRDVGTNWIDVGNHFEVQSRLLPNGHVLLDLSPVESARIADGRIVSASAHLQIELAPGELRVLGGLESGGDRSDADPTQSSHRSSHSGRLLLLHVE